jgi:hypothetical protein
VKLGGEFDLIWCGSLITRLSDERVRELLSLFRDAMPKGGLLVFSTHGEHVAQRLRRGARYDLPENSSADILAAYAQSGWGYAGCVNRPTKPGQLQPLLARGFS